MFKDNTIEKRVMSVIKERISIVQQKYDDGVKELEDKLEFDKESLADKFVDEIIGKVI